MGNKTEGEKSQKAQEAAVIKGIGVLVALAVGLGLTAAVVAFALRHNKADDNPVALSGVREAAASVSVGPDGLTNEQRNVRDRLAEDSKPGAIKHLYVFSAYSGQALLYSTVKGKVTSSGKRLSPYTVYAGTHGSDGNPEHEGIPVKIGGQTHHTSEVLQDDGTYGHSMEYLYWWDVRGVYHHHYLTGGQILHISSEPMPVKSVVLNIEALSRAEK
jgi:hypothetical protein